MSDLQRNALADRIKRYDEAKKRLAQWEGEPSLAPDDRALVEKTRKFVREYVMILVRDGTVAPYLGLNFVDEVLTLVLGRELRARLADLNLSEVVKVVQEIPAKEDDK